MKPRKWTLEKLQAEALKYESRGEFKKNSPSAYAIAHIRGVVDIICRHMPQKISRFGENHPSFKWKFEKIIKEALKYKTRNAFRKGGPGAYDAAHSRGILDEVCSHMPKYVDRSGKNSNSFKWTFKKLKREALKFKTKTEFRKKSNGAYQAAIKQGLLEEICSHMPERNILNGENIYNFKWSYEKLKEEALKYKTRSDFRKGSSGAYDAARDRDILDEICVHMKRDHTISLLEQELFDAIKIYYSSAKKFRDRKVKIQSKPYIKGFDIDIFIPELMLGIEFDGKYHHSFDHMRKSKNKKLWSDNDILNYHEIKDAWFLTKNIDILHIKEEDWLGDKQACIDKCLEFLSVEQKRVA